MRGTASDLRRLLAALLVLARWHLARAQPEANVNQETLPVRVGLLATENFPFSQPAPEGTAAANSAGLEGFEVALMNALCERARLNCTAVPITDLEGRLEGLSNDLYDLTISALSYTPGRAAVAHFVKPFYYSSGVALFSDSAARGLDIISGPGSKPGSELGSAPAGWRGVFSGHFPVGQTVCFVRGYYALPFVLEDLKDINIKLSNSLEEAASKVRGGECAAVAYDSTMPASTVGLPLLPVPPAYNSPYGVAMRPRDAGSELEQRLVWALTGVMNENSASQILKLEQEWLVPSGVGPSSALMSVVNAISSFGEPLNAAPGSIPASYSLFGRSPGGRRLLAGGGR